MKTLFIITFFLLASTSYATTHVAVIDTGLDIQDPRLSAHLCKGGHKDFTGEGLKDTYGHGTHVVGLIEKYAKDVDYCLYILKFWSQGSNDEVNVSNYLKALEYATSVLKVNIVNISCGGKEENVEESEIIRTHSKTIFIVAAGNNGQNLDFPENAYYPASYKYFNIRAVGSVCDQITSPFSNYGTQVVYNTCGEKVISTLPNNATGEMHGTSQSTAIETGRYIYETHFSLN